MSLASHSRGLVSICAEGTQYVAVGGRKGKAEVRGDPEISDGKVGAKERICSYILDDQWLTDDAVVLAKGVRQWGLAVGAKWLGLEPDATLEELTVGIDQRDKSDGHVQESGGESR